MTDFLKLAAGLSNYNDGRYDGYVIGKAEWMLNGSVQIVESNIIKEKKDYLAIEVTGYDLGHLLTGRLIISMLKGKQEIFDGEAVLRHGDEDLFLIHKDVPQKPDLKKTGTPFCFNQNDVKAYLETVHDTNPIHRGQQAIVPGLMLLDFILEREYISHGMESGRVRFINPLKVGTPFIFRKHTRELQIVSDSGKVCYAKIQLFPVQQ